MFYKRKDACKCVYCKHYFAVQYENDYFVLDRGICKKYDILRKPEGNICDFFILKSGVYTKNGTPIKNKSFMLSHKGFKNNSKI